MDNVQNLIDAVERELGYGPTEADYDAIGEHGFANTYGVTTADGAVSKRILSSMLGVLRTMGVDFQRKPAWTVRRAGDGGLDLVVGLTKEQPLLSCDDVMARMMKPAFPNAA